MFGRLLVVAVLAVVLWQACAGDPTGSAADPIRVTVGDTISGSLGASDGPRNYAFGAAAGEFYAVFFQLVSGGGLILSVEAATVPPSNLALISTTQQRPLSDLATEVFALGQAADVRIHVTRATSGPGEYRFVVHHVAIAPENRPAAFALGDTVSGESLETIVDVDRFTFAGQAGDTLFALVQALGASGTGALEIEVGNPNAVIGRARSSGGDPVLTDQVSGAFTLPSSGQYLATVSSVSPFANERRYQGPYRFAVVRFRRGPEIASPTVILGDTVTEEIKPSGDIDEYQFTGSTGQEVNLFFQARSGAALDNLYLDVPVLVGGYPASVMSFGADTSLFMNAVGRFTLTSPGPHKVVVLGALGGPGGDRGPYRFLVYPINRQPEAASGTLNPGDSLTETIELPGDIDEFAMSLADTTLVEFILERDPAVAQGVVNLGVNLAGAPEPPAGCGGGLDVVPGLTAQGRLLTLVPGVHRVSVCAESRGAAYRGNYVVKTYVISGSPESRGDTIAIGDTISTEGLDVPGDFDTFVFYGRKDRHIDVQFQGLASPNLPGFSLGLVGTEILAFVGTPASAPSLSGQRTKRVDLPNSGWYRAQIELSGNGAELYERGAYRFAVVSIPGNPESVSPNLTVGDSVTSEPFSDLEDVDEFVLTGSPNQEIAVLFSTDGTGGLTAPVYDTTSDQIIAYAIAGAGRRSSGRFLLPASGIAGIRVYSPRPCPSGIICLSAGAPGTYFLAPIAINRAPEGVSATVTRGDTVSELIAPISDVDEFTFLGTAGDTVNVLLTLPVNFGYPGVQLQFIDTTDGSVLATVSAINPAPVGDVATGPIPLPHTGSYLVRVQSSNDKDGQGAYRFVIR